MCIHIHSTTTDVLHSISNLLVAIIQVNKEEKEKKKEKKKQKKGKEEMRVLPQTYTIITPAGCWVPLYSLKANFTACPEAESANDYQEGCPFAI